MVYLQPSLIRYFRGIKTFSVSKVHVKVYNPTVAQQHISLPNLTQGNLFTFSDNILKQIRQDKTIQKEYNNIG